MTTSERVVERVDVEAAADNIVATWAENNQGVAEVIPSDEIEDQLGDLVDDRGSFDGETWETLVLATKDAVLERGLIIV